MRLVSSTFGAVWTDLLRKLYYAGQPVQARGIATRELTGISIKVEDSLANILVNDIRNLNYKFMIAEWLWIWFGHSDVATIVQYNHNIAQFSDNGVDFFGAYGPPIRAQWPVILGLFRRDISTRQAVIQIYRGPEAMTKDVPCTLSIQFLVRRNVLETIVTMRSSDVWLGLPYDFFNFSMFANLLSAQLSIGLGPVTMHLGSSHLYDINVQDAERICIFPKTLTIFSPKFKELPPSWLDDELIKPSSNRYTSEPWASYVSVLQCKTRKEALEVLSANFQ